MGRSSRLLLAAVVSSLVFGLARCFSAGGPGVNSSRRPAPLAAGLCGHQSHALSHGCRNGQGHLPSRPAATEVVPAVSGDDGSNPLRRVVVTASSVGLCLVGLVLAASKFEVLAHNSISFVSGSGALAATAAGGAAGALHTLAGPDHLAALAPLVTGGRQKPTTAFLLGALWGSGHAAGQVLLGLAALAARAGLFASFGWMSIVASSLRKIGGGLVGAALIFIGLVGFQEVREARRAAAAGEVAEHAEDAASKYGWATFATGVAHGLQPDALLFIMPALALPAKAAIGFVIAFGVGTLLSMGVCGVFLAQLCRNNPGRVELISTTASCVAIVLGAAILATCFGLDIPLLGLSAIGRG